MRLLADTYVEDVGRGAQRERRAVDDEGDGGQAVDLAAFNGVLGREGGRELGVTGSLG